MIRIRYKDLSPGLHGKAEHCARGVTVYLLPGLTGGQRKAALRRLRQEASRGCGPALPAPQLLMALGADRVRVGVKNTAAVVRLHPAGSLLPTAAAGVLMTLFVLTSVSVRIVRVPTTPAGVPTGGALVTVPATASTTASTAASAAARAGALAAARPGAGVRPGPAGRAWLGGALGIRGRDAWWYGCRVRFDVGVGERFPARPS